MTITLVIYASLAASYLRAYVTPLLFAIRRAAALLPE